MSTVLFSLFNHPILPNILQSLNFELGKVKIHRFPDQESMIDILSDIKGKKVVVCDSLDRPDDKILPLLLFAKTAIELGATDIGLVSLYCPFMRQDAKFTPGQSFSARCFAHLLQEYFNWIVIPEPHLHRVNDLNDIFTIAAHRLHLTQLIGDFVARRFPDHYIIGPDGESLQWAKNIATRAGCEYGVLNKVRHGDSHVEVSFDQLDIRKNQPILIVDDIISTGNTILEAKKSLQNAGLIYQKPSLICIHGLFVKNSYQLLETEFKNVLSCNTAIHKSNTIDISSDLVKALSGLVG